MPLANRSLQQTAAAPLGQLADLAHRFGLATAISLSYLVAVLLMCQIMKVNYPFPKAQY